MSGLGYSKKILRMVFGRAGQPQDGIWWRIRKQAADANPPGVPLVRLAVRRPTGEYNGGTCIGERCALSANRRTFGRYMTKDSAGQDRV
jgi:hypothetical protein